MAIKVGQKAPDLKINDQDGKLVSLSEFKGKKVVLYFYPKDQTPGCTTEACNLRDNYKLLLKKGYEVLGISTDSEKSHQKFIEKQNLPFRLLADVDKSVHDKYGTWIEKSMYGRKYMGTARVTFIIDEKGVVEEIIGKVDTKNHADQILNPDATLKSIAKKADVLKVSKKGVKKTVKKKG
jgi:peroxiredoxin Q/BCP